jgi:hypothetical protein
MHHQNNSLKALDEVLKRLFCDSDFRQQLRRDAAEALASYNLTTKQREVLSRLQTRPLPADPTLALPQEHIFSRN